MVRPTGWSEPREWAARGSVVMSLFVVGPVSPSGRRRHFSPSFFPQ